MSLLHPVTILPTKPVACVGYSFIMLINSQQGENKMTSIIWNKCYEKSKVVQDSLIEMVGERLVSVEGLKKESEEVVFITESGKAIKLHHDQDCCESVALNDFECDVNDFSGVTVLSAEEINGETGESDDYESFTWTFYKIETDRGGLWMRWLGESNGYYSEAVDILGGTVNQ